MTKARNLANFVSDGNPLADGTIEVTDINGVTATAAELNILDGATITTAELNHVSGVTSPIQTQLNAKIIAGNNLSDLTDVSAAKVNLQIETAAKNNYNFFTGQF